ncbi:MAG: aldo/keto reductase [Atopobiaceae bacterium]|jgi:predicted aldo/keto reductase-like oxidoreductase|nr:aldo/keto reductase [Atopobiaceae bacterium]MCI2172606.1 aldo/keto reductase [Atopobiaceae bacterium]MCI2206913.1 aldo/keto reductase [Atopobiaceae bacterium]
MAIERRVLGRTGIEVSPIALGCEGFEDKTDQSEADRLMAAALDAGVNMLDVYTANPRARSLMGHALAGRPRDSYVIEGHLCSYWDHGQYRRTRRPEEVREAFDDLLARLGTDHVDVGMIHYVDERADFDAVFEGPVIDYALELRRQGRIHHIGMSTHNPEVGLAAVETGLVDVILFSVNPGYDMMPPSEDVNILFEHETFEGRTWQVQPERQAFYQACERAGVAITVMKCFAGGMLLRESASPLGVALTPAQAIAYALDRPAVAAVMLGAHTPEEVAVDASYADASAAERDYSQALAHAAAGTMEGHCVYCGHCAPCPRGISVANVGKYLDLAKAQLEAHEEVPETVREHYLALSHHAGECVGCGACEGRCPFGVGVIGRMREATAIFGE